MCIEMGKKAELIACDFNNMFLKNVPKIKGGRKERKKESSPQEEASLCLYQ
jgi:hypothetical protein